MRACGSTGTLDETEFAFERLAPNAVLSVIVKRKHIRSFIERELDRLHSCGGEDFVDVRDNELPVCEHGLTAMLSDMFEANGLSITPAYDANHAASAEGWALIMRAIKCLKGIRWMPWR